MPASVARCLDPRVRGDDESRLLQGHLHREAELRRSQDALRTTAPAWRRTRQLSAVHAIGPECPQAMPADTAARGAGDARCTEGAWRCLQRLSARSQSIRPSVGPDRRPCALCRSVSAVRAQEAHPRRRSDREPAHVRCVPARSSCRPHVPNLCDHGCGSRHGDSRSAQLPTVGLHIP